MKQPISFIIIARDPRTHKEVHSRHDALTRFPRLALLGLCLRIFFGRKF